MDREIGHGCGPFSEPQGEGAVRPGWVRSGGGGFFSIPPSHPLNRAVYIQLAWWLVVLSGLPPVYLWLREGIPPYGYGHGQRAPDTGRLRSAGAY